jgi:hypothetical protein
MERNLKYYKDNCEEDCINTPISVLRYITELEQSDSNMIKQKDEFIKQLEKWINDCELQEQHFFDSKIIGSLLSCRGMKQGYKNVLELIKIQTNGIY